MVAEKVANKDGMDDVPKRKPRFLYGHSGHPCNGNTFWCETSPTSCHNCGGQGFYFIRGE